MKLTANKPCSFGGQKFRIGEEIPAELVANPKAQEKMGVISIADGETEANDGYITIPIYKDNEIITLSVTNEELNVFTDIRQIGVNSTEDKQKISDLIQNIESEDLLIILDALDGRKHIHEEVIARMQVISEPETATGEQGGDE